MNEIDRLERLLSEVGQDMREQTSVVQPVMDRIAGGEDQPRAEPRNWVTSRGTAKSLSWKWMMRSTLGVAASALLILGVWSVFDAASSKALAWSDVVAATQKADSVHCVIEQRKDDQWITRLEFWYDRDRGIVEIRDVAGRQHQRIDDGAHQWRYITGDDFATRTQSVNPQGIVARLLEPLKFAGSSLKRNTQGDTEIGGARCNSYVALSEEGDKRFQIWVDGAGRLQRIRESVREDGRWSDYVRYEAEFDKHVDPRRFEPSFGGNVRIVDVSTAFGQHFSLEAAVHRTTEHGFEVAVHDVKRLEDNALFVLISIRPTEETRRQVRLEEGLRYAHFHASGWPDDLRRRHILQRAIHLASFEADGIHAYAYVYTHEMRTPDRLDAAHLQFTISPHHELRRGRGAPPKINLKLALPAEQTTVKAAVESLYEEATGIEPLHADVLDLFLQPRELTDSELETQAKTFKTTVDEILVNGVPMTSRTARPSEIVFEEYWKEVQSKIEQRPSLQTRWPKDPRLAAIARIMRGGGQFEKDASGRRVGLRWYGATDETLDLLEQVVDLKWIEFAGDQVTDVGLAKLSGQTKLQKLTLRNTPVTGDGLAFLRNLTELRELAIYTSSVLRLGAAELENLRGSQHLEKLELINCEIENDGLASLSKLSKLRVLRGQGIRVTDAGLRHLAELSQLRVLYLLGTGCTDDGLQHLVRLSNLQELAIPSRHLTDAGLIHLKELTSLRSLDLRFTQVSDEGLHHLQALKQLSRLDVGHSQVTANGAERLKESLPEVEISLD